MPTDQQIRQRMSLLMLIWGAMCASGFVYGGALYSVIKGRTPEQVAELAKNAASIASLTTIFGVVSGVVAILALFVIPNLVGKKVPFVGFIVGLALAESICIYGFVLGLQGASMTVVYSFIGGGIFCLVVQMPTRKLATAVAESKGRSFREE
ncbi:MAG: hypothetical protein H6727_11295 [Myxococcales bacterium]|nr:hypothetical protein [Myxococcales bacterium]